MTLASSSSSSSPRKGTRITTFCILLLMHTIVIIELGQSLISQQVATLLSSSTPSPLPQHTIQSSYSKRRILRESERFNRRRTTEQPHIDSFIEQFKDTLANNATSSIDNSTATTTSSKNFAALILKGNKVYCRSSQIQSLSRARYFVQMLREGLKQQPMTRSNVSNDDLLLPILIKHDDSNGCYPTTQHDKYGFPRLTWSIPAKSTTSAAIRGSKSPLSKNSWCSAIGMPSYKQWKDVYKKKKRSRRFQNNKQLLPNNNNEVRYPWNNKISKAVWRGSTTANKSIYGHLSFNDLPRSRLVQISINDRPDLVDAGYHKFVGKYENGTAMMDDESRQRMWKEAIPLDDMMRYKAIIDIDGNSWSARFHTLLCSNSIIIKIQPDFIESYYNELQPYVHYIPATLTNLTSVVQYVLDGENDVQMKNVVKNANKWCEQSTSMNVLTRRAVNAVDEYYIALKEYYNQYTNRQRMMMELELDKAKHDMVECIV